MSQAEVHLQSQAQPTISSHKGQSTQSPQTSTAAKKKTTKKPAAKKPAAKKPAAKKPAAKKPAQVKESPAKDTTKQHPSTTDTMAEHPQARSQLYEAVCQTSAAAGPTDPKQTPQATGHHQNQTDSSTHMAQITLEAYDH